MCYHSNYYHGNNHHNKIKIAMKSTKVEKPHCYAGKQFIYYITVGVASLSLYNTLCIIKCVALISVTSTSGSNSSTSFNPYIIIYWAWHSNWLILTSLLPFSLSVSWFEIHFYQGYLKMMIYDGKTDNDFLCVGERVQEQE